MFEPAVFARDQQDDQEVGHREHQQRPRKMRRQTIDLIAGEGGQHGDGGGKRPEFAPQQVDHEEDSDGTMNQEINAPKQFSARLQVTEGVAQRVGNQIIRVLQQLRAGKLHHQAH
jgi:hypothetical protein